MSAHNRVNTSADDDDGIHLQLSRRPVGRSPYAHLTMLVALLGLVVFAMYKARDPKSWEWMGFDKQPAPDTNSTLPDGLIRIDNVEHGDREAEINTESRPNDDLLVEIRNHFRQRDHVASAPTSPEQRKIMIKRSFWSQLFEHMNNHQRLYFYRLLVERIEPAPIPQARDSQTTKSDSNESKLAIPAMELNALQFVHFLERQRNAFDAAILQQTADLSPEHQRENKLWSDLLLEMQTEWSQHIIPSIKAIADAKALDSQQLESIDRLVELWRSIAWEFITDYSVLGLARDHSAWNMCWYELANDLIKADEAPVLPIVDLMAQAELHRSKPVTIKGNLQRIQKVIPRGKNPVVSPYYVMWIKPLERSKTPYCAYVARLPSGFQNVTQENLELDDPVTLTGVFFKIMVYTDDAKTGASCPLVLANSFVWEPIDGSNQQSDTGIDFSSPWVYGALLGIVLLAVFVSWGVWKFEKSPQRVDGKNKRNRVQKSMTDLEDRSDIRNVKEQLSLLEKSKSKADT